MAAPPNFGLVLRSSNPLVKREVQYMRKMYGKYINFDASTTKKHVSSYGAVESVRKNAEQLIGGCFEATARPPKSMRPVMERCDWYAWLLKSK